MDEAGELESMEAEGDCPAHALGKMTNFPKMPPSAWERVVGVSGAMGRFICLRSPRCERKAHVYPR